MPEMSWSESEYWDTEISDQEIDEEADAGERLLLQPFFLPYRVRKVVWNNRIKKRNRQQII